MNMKLETMIDTFLTTIGLTYGLAQIHEILGIVILVLNICWMMSRLAYNIYVKVKNKDFKGIEEDVNKTLDDLSSIKDSIAEKEKEKEDGEHK